MTNEPTAEPKIEPWMVRLADDLCERYHLHGYKMQITEIIARHAPPCPRCRRVDEFIEHRDFIHVAELKAEIDK